ncbi:hypothetical protein GW17_00019979, partial [Ensete ventricosum]
ATPPSSLVVSACAQASYPSVCVRTLATSSPSTPSDLALAATSASLSTTRGAAAYLRRLTLPQTPSDRAAFRDCANLLSDAADQLARAAKELARLNPDTLRSQLGDAQTWASAAMTDQTCASARSPGSPAAPGTRSSPGSRRRRMSPATRSTSSPASPPPVTGTVDRRWSCADKTIGRLISLCLCKYKQLFPVWF